MLEAILQAHATRYCLTKSFLRYVESFIDCIESYAILFKPKFVHIDILSVRHKKVINHGSMFIFGPFPERETRLMYVRPQILLYNFTKSIINTTVARESISTHSDSFRYSTPAMVSSVCSPLLGLMTTEYWIQWTESLFWQSILHDLKTLFRIKSADYEMSNQFEYESSK